MEPITERRADYPDLLILMTELRESNRQLEEKIEEHINETREITELYLHSRWLIGTLKFLAATAAAILSLWIAVKQLGAVH
jgi:hypothetical protein